MVVLCPNYTKLTLDELTGAASNELVGFLEQRIVA